MARVAFYQARGGGSNQFQRAAGPVSKVFADRMTNGNAMGWAVLDAVPEMRGGWRAAEIAVAVFGPDATRSAVTQPYWATFAELIRTPFLHVELVWGIVPLYFALLLNEMTSAKATFRSAIQTGFSFLWAGAQWLYPCFKSPAPGSPRLAWEALSAVNVVVTLLVLGFGALALVSGLRRRFPRYASFLGYTRFSNYFMIALYPIQAHYLAWTWDRLLAIALFAVPTWLILHFGLWPIRNRNR
jgi:hypothetical protein